MIFANRNILAENFHIFLLATKWLKDWDLSTNFEFMAYLSILSDLGESN